MKPTKIITEMHIPPDLAPLMARHGARSVESLTKFLEPCGPSGEKLGALSILMRVLLAYGDAIQADELNRSATGAAH